jgi:hypothetical protein
MSAIGSSPYSLRVIVLGFRGRRGTRVRSSLQTGGVLIPAPRSAFTFPGGIAAAGDLGLEYDLAV